MQAEWDRLPDRDPDAASATPSLAALEAPTLATSFEHSAPAAFEAGQPMIVAMRIHSGDGQADSRVDLHYRHVNQTETYVVAPMLECGDGCFEATVPADYTDSPYPPQYFFVAHRDSQAQRFPDLAADLANQPYVVVRQRSQHSMRR